MDSDFRNGVNVNEITAGHVPGTLVHPCRRAGTQLRAEDAVSSGAANTTNKEMCCETQDRLEDPAFVTCDSCDPPIKWHSPPGISARCPACIIGQGLDRPSSREAGVRKLASNFFGLLFDCLRNRLRLTPTPLVQVRSGHTQTSLRVFVDLLTITSIQIFKV